jgi:hypothetical protein
VVLLETIGFETCEPESPVQVFPFPDTVHETASVVLQAIVMLAPGRTIDWDAVILPVTSGMTQELAPFAQNRGATHVAYGLTTETEQLVLVLVWMMDEPEHE